MLERTKENFSQSFMMIAVIVVFGGIKYAIGALPSRQTNDNVKIVVRTNEGEKEINTNERIKINQNDYIKVVIK